MIAGSLPQYMYSTTLSYAGVPDLFREVRERAHRHQRIVDYTPAARFLVNRESYARTDLDSEVGMHMLSLLTLLPVWGMAKTIYRFDPTMVEALGETDTDLKLPGSTFDRLPVLCPYIEFPIEGPEGDSIRGFFVAKVHGANEEVDTLVLLVTFLHAGAEDPSVKAIFIKLDASISVRAMLESCYLSSARVQVPTLEEADSMLRKLLSPILYLCSAGADIQYRTPTAPPRHIANALPEKPRIADVGLRIGSAIRSYRIAQAKRDTDAAHTGRTLVPHVRRAHWHHYWTGALDRPRTLILKWIPPIPVNLDKGELPVTIRPVKA